ncbi:LacI family DNA-binding transcriptional regulator [Clostridium chauvoei]|uniref:LacI family DNA-binding transcriptional regulator n=2 Tax=Clostridium chauvoei TaxID=46867 RepID=A0ABD4RK13_9CLOT|nr:LacI family DNA-binding transcriptional regulator [Clostridium chauvoei]ATD53764.1 LacI family transcriptional regulator [Clostridium chauvoei]ATD56285.1 LacI family transcriptional regulator [Clostridium chauvoei]MBX7281457.1 LacI family DNA-binding transcriptional regulator [Clostridium chauvoei]MBX7283985.1 LacI family DNA-binding transcriptional regulator [Clostridium chauvoei]MBX7286505.1 LacI family DNA-binding transcriptional regulator [Clostridium chauvoei]
MKITIKDVAKEANVSPSTVSRVLSNSNRISEETKTRVNKAVQKLNYTPNIIARGLANNRTKILAAVLPQSAEGLFENPFFIQAMRGMSIYAQKENYYIMYAFKEDDKDDEVWIRRFIDSNLVDGICLLNSKEDDKCIKYLKEQSVDFVVIGRPEEASDVLWVDNNNVKAMKDLVCHLIKKGHKRIGFMGARGNLNVSIDRLKGYQEALIDNGIKIDSNLIMDLKNFTEEQGYKGAKSLLSIVEPTAIVTTDDLLAFGVQKYLLEKNITTIDLVGFNNSPLSKYQNPPLSSVDINSNKLGYYAAKLLIDKLEGRIDGVSNYIIETELIERESIKK